MALVSHLDHLLDMADLNFTFDNGGKARVLSKYISTVPHQLGIFSGIFMTVIGKYMFTFPMKQRARTHTLQSARYQRQLPCM